MAHPTNGGRRWDVPKGMADPGEDPLDAALRECLEETGFDATPYRGKIADLGRHQYRKGKDMHMFVLRIPEALSTKALRCTSMVEPEGRAPFPEIDGFAWMLPEKAITVMAKGLQALLEKWLAGPERDILQP
jgi:putative (di)nucleoside polyphosphate hydrolase